MTNQELKIFLQKNVDRLFRFKAENGEIRYVLCRIATKENLRAHLRLLERESQGMVQDPRTHLWKQTNPRKRISKKSVRAAVNAAWVEEFLEAIEPGFREGARTAAGAGIVLPPRIIFVKLCHMSWVSARLEIA